MDVYSSFTCNCQNLETTKMSSVVHQENRIIFDAKKKCAIKPWKDREILNEYYFFSLIFQNMD